MVIRHDNMDLLHYLKLQIALRRFDIAASK